jgi:hypothetical protein
VPNFSARASKRPVPKHAPHQPQVMTGILRCGPCYAYATMCRMNFA